MPFKQWFDEHFETIREDYFRFLRFKSVSTDDQYRPQVLACADFLTEYLKKHDFYAEQIPTIGYPIVYAEDLRAGKDVPTLLIYGHYDVQPVDPVELWESPPFEPTEREGKIFARGAVDNKGQIFYTLTALIAWKKIYKSLPVNIKFCIEGEEESHSMGLSAALPKLKDRLKADELLIVDFDSANDGTPHISLGARGCIALEVTLKGSNQDLHSGQMGGVAYNPNRALVQLLAKIWDIHGTVTIPGFYDGVEDPSEEDLKNYTFSVKEEELNRDFGIFAFANEKGRTLQESNWFRPTLEINGIFGGYSGKGSKTVIPATATAKITCRLVLNQDAQKVSVAIEKFLKKHAPIGMDIQVLKQGGIGAYRSSLNTQLTRAVAKAATDITGKKSAFVLSGASIPIAGDFKKVMNIPVVGMGYGLATDRIHAPNEHFDWKRFEIGFLTIARILSNYEMDR
jgi:acetylornithine deacetylase/succinyl-diaminopimelate desuccinylase-like protein